MINAEQLNAIKERAAKATPGPWEVCNGTDVFTPLGSENKAGIQANHNDGWYIAKANEGTTTVGDEETSLSFSEQNANARFISSCREDVPALVAEVELLRQQLEKAEGLLGWAHDILDDVHCYETDIYQEISEYFGKDD